MSAIDVLPKIINTDRLVLRQFKPEDSPSVFRYASDPEVTRYMDWPTHASPDVSQAWIQSTLAEWQSGESYTWAITKADDSEFVIGAIGCTALSFKVSFGYVLNKDAWGHGFATEAASEVLDILSHTEGIKRIWATCDCENPTSAKVLSKLGCSLEGVLRCWSVRPNLPGAPARDSYMYAKLIQI